MGVDRTDYIVHGYQLELTEDYEGNEIDFWDDEFLPMIEGHIGEDFSLITGEHGTPVFGKILAQEDGGKYYSWDPFDITQAMKTLEDPTAIMNRYRQLFKIPENGIVPEPTVFIFTSIT